MKIVANNKKAYFNYFIEDKEESGIELLGWEVKSARAGKVSLVDSFVFFGREKGEKEGNIQAWLKNAHFSPFEHGVVKDQEVRRDRRLLLRRAQIEKFYRAVMTKGVTCVVTKLYFSKGGYLKAEIALARGKQLHDKKQVIKERDLNREAEREIRGK
ncbi:MAG: SsrA-binding protein SmpB [Firmicutes bacterium]|nr:SsrA-binding protein SmpB [Bacillota bacterium]